jgi:hypothetical protein
MTPILFESEQSSEAIVKLLSETVLGCNGARYRHCDTVENIQKIDNPLFLTLQRKEMLLANVTFCRREGAWYVRHFVFRSKAMAKKTKSKKQGFIRQQLNYYFQGKLYNLNCTSFYAYIDPSNIRSKQIAESFGFEKIGTIYTQTFSRISSRNSTRVTQEIYNSEIENLIQTKYGQLPYFFDDQLRKGTFYTLRDDQNQLLALTNVHRTQWQWQRLPGKIGGILVKLLPLLPFFRRIFNPKAHHFIVFDTVISLSENVEELTELFSATLKQEKVNTAIWWIHENNKLHNKMSKVLSWGPLHTINGVHPVDLMALGEPKINASDETYVNGFDFI